MYSRYQTAYPKTRTADHRSLKTTILRSRITANDMASIMANMDVRDDLCITNAQTARNVFICLRRLVKTCNFAVTTVEGYMHVERIG